MGYNTIRVGDEIPSASTRIELCHDMRKTMVWLQLTVPDVSTQKARPTYTKHLIGAVKDGTGWKALPAGAAARGGHVTLPFGDLLCDQKMQAIQQWPVERFQKAIIADWKSFDGTRIEHYAKPLSRGFDLSNPSFVMKALKTGFDAIGIAGHAYSGLQFRGFTVDDVISYMKRAAATQVSVAEPGLEGFKAVAPLPGQIDDAPFTTDKRAIHYITSAKAHGGRFAYPEIDLKVPLKRVIGYGFRGEKRPPGEVKEAGGFTPNYTRPDHITQAAKRNLPEGNALNLETFLTNQFYGGFISFTKSVRVARGFATNVGKTTGSRGRHAGWVYACYVQGAFDIPPSGVIPASATHPQFTVSADEQEMALPGMLDWDDVVGCRSVDASGTLQGNIYLRANLEQEDGEAAGKILQLLSGQSQDP